MRTQENRVGGAVGFNMRTGDFHVFRAKTVIVAAGGASHIFSNQEQLVKEWEEPGMHHGVMAQHMHYLSLLELK